MNKASRADLAAKKLIRPSAALFKVRFEDGYPVAISVGSTDLVRLISGDCRTMVCAETLVALLNASVQCSRHVSGVVAQYRASIGLKEAENE